MAEFSQSELLALINKTQSAVGNERVRSITQRIVTDLFRTIDEFDVTPEEFWSAMKWLSRLGESGQVGLITAGLGFDRLLDIRDDEADRRAGRALGTPRAIEGPLYVPGAPVSQYETRLDDGTEGGSALEVLVMEGRVLDLEGRPVAGALVDLWHANEHGRYSHFDPSQADYHLRRRIEADAQGRYRFRSFVPPGYAIPPNSPTSELFELLGRHGNRPAHIHFLISAPGQRALTTQINIPGDTFLDDDFAFATRDGLVVTLEKVSDASGYESLGVTGPFTRAQFDFRLQRAIDSKEALPESRYEKAA